MVWPCADRVFTTAMHGEAVLDPVAVVDGQLDYQGFPEGAVLLLLASASAQVEGSGTMAAHGRRGRLAAGTSDPATSAMTAGAMMPMVRKFGAVAAVALTLILAASPSVASSTVTTTGSTTTPPMPRTVSATSPCPAGPVTIPATHVPSSGLVEVDLDNHRRFDPTRVLPLDNPQTATFAGGDLYVSYMPVGPEDGFRVERIDPKTGVLARSPWFPGYEYNSPPVVAFGSVWVVAGLCEQQIVRMDQETLAVTMRVAIGKNLDSGPPVASDGALWLSSTVFARLARLNPHTGHIGTVVLPEMAPNSQVVGITSGPDSDYLYVSVINQNVAHSQVTERFDPATGSFFVVPTPPLELTRVIGVAGDILWVIQGGGMMEHFAPFSTTSLAPLPCARVVTCVLAGINGTITGRVKDGIFAFEHVGGSEGAPGFLLLDCIGSPRVSTVARLQLPSDLATPDSPVLLPSLLAFGEGYLATLARVGSFGGSGVAIFPLDPRCAS
jgi:hypothetical protein